MTLHAKHCVVCRSFIEKWGDDPEFRTDRAGVTPYCERCWVWQAKVDALEERIAKLEQRNQWRGNPKRRSPYDLSRR